MNIDFNLVHEYIKAIEKELAAGNATEHTHRPALKTFIEGLAKGITATNEPTRIKCGAPDFIITKGVPLSVILRTKDVDENLSKIENSYHIKRYLESLSNFILTDYIEFRWYVDGKSHIKRRNLEYTPVAK